MLYVTSALAMGDGFVFFNGEGDTYLTRTTVLKRALDGLWSSVSAVSERARGARPYGASSEVAVLGDEEQNARAS
jgi:hypothetical protein